MSENTTTGTTGQAEPLSRTQIPFWQRVCDNHFLLLFIGVVVPTVFYLIWGIMEIAQIPVAPQ